MNKKILFFLLLFISTSVSKLSVAKENQISDKVKQQLDNERAYVLNISNKDDDLHKIVKINDKTSEIIADIASISDIDKKIKTYKEQEKKFEDGYFNFIDKHNIYLKASVGTYGYGSELSYYYKNHIGATFIFNYQDKIFSDALNRILHFYGGTLRDDDEFKINSINYGFALSYKPFKGSFHIDAGFLISKNITYLYIVETNGVKHEKDIILDNFKIKPYLNFGWDFIPYNNIVIGLNIGFTMMNSLSMEEAEQISDNFREELHLDASRFSYGTLPYVTSFAPFFKLNLGYKFSF